MTGLHDKRATTESGRSKRLERSKPEAAAAAAPPARRARHAEGLVPPRKRESHVPATRRRAAAPVPPPNRAVPVPAAAARVATPPSPPYGDRDPGDVTVAPPPAPRAEAPAPPPKRFGCGRVILPRTAYSLRNRLVPDTSKPKPMPMPTPKNVEIREERKRGQTWQTPMCARVGLEYYNSMNQDDEHELVKAVSSNAFVFNGIWFHANFLAKRKGATNCVDLVPKYFFAELVGCSGGHSCVSCVKLAPGDPKNIGGCSLCSEKMMHPAGGGYHGAQPRPVRHAPDGLQISFSF
ncbi:hypothetical protein QYE76_061064 [Lolium multiflorum]|uniref:DUF3615 domain-containing protein n=1 Tax=Lolium multiflorum TaxID=4521 RepID=A0AAD8S091_LOLMU|nr:hypothetical protein QYE76_061064 [Lolium multiflorum]